MKRLMLVAGARPNFVKVAPLARALRLRPRFHLTFVNTGQHYDWEMAGVFLSDLGLPTPDHDLGVGSGTHVAQVSMVMTGLEPLFVQLKPDLVLVVGDVNSTVAAAIAAAKSGVPVAHVEAGLRSFDRTMPEEINRIVTDVLSEFLFVPSQDGVDNLIREGIPPDRIHLVGNVMIDTLDALLPQAVEARTADTLGLEEGTYAVATLHRPSNVDEPAELQRIVELLAMIHSHFPTIFPCHPRTRARLEADGSLGELEALGVRTVQPMGYVEFLSLLRTACVVITDSGGIQEEATVLGVPCITYRDRTERPITVSEGTNVLVSVDHGLIASELARIAAGYRVEARRPHLWDGHAAERIAAILEQSMGLGAHQLS